LEDGELLLIGIAAVVGLAFGSFGTVAAYRIPRGETIVSGRSKCPACGRTITAIENVPVFSYLFLRGRCRGCGNRISIRYPLTELATAILFGLAAWKFGTTVDTLIFAAFFWALVVLSAIDLELKLLPNKVVYPTFAVAWVVVAATALVHGEPERLLDAAVGSAVFGGFFLLVALIYPAGMGGGDVKLAFVLGTLLGYAEGVGVVVVGMFLSFLLGAVGGGAVMLLAGGSRKSQVPFGPFLALGTVIAVLAGRVLLDQYLELF
jgi:leader peptidase (prepilin peptidase) / N-methyltransferase